MTAARYLRRGRLRAWVAPGVDLEHAIADDGDPDHLLTRPDCRIVKLQRKVVVGRIETAAGTLWVKRYAVFAWRVALASLGRTSPAFGAWAGAAALAAHGVAAPAPLAAIERSPAAAGRSWSSPGARSAGRRARLTARASSAPTSAGRPGAPSGAPGRRRSRAAPRRRTAGAAPLRHRVADRPSPAPSSARTRRRTWCRASRASPGATRSWWSTAARATGRPRSRAVSRTASSSTP